MKKNKFSPTLKIICSYIPVVALLIGMGVQNKISISVLVNDIFSVADVPAYTGMVSNLGVLIWCFSGSIALFCYSLSHSFAWPRSRQNFFLWAGSLSLLMMTDDLFMLHERFFQTYFGIPEEITFAIYAMLFFSFITLFRKRILELSFIFLVLTVLFLGFSTGMDVVENILFPGEVSTPRLFRLFEEGSKLLGIFSWGAYLAQYCYQVLTRHYKTLAGLEMADPK